jgi:hypothetical protein
MRGKKQVYTTKKIHVISDEAEVMSSHGMLGMLDHGRSCLAMLLVLTCCRIYQTTLYTSSETITSQVLMENSEQQRSTLKRETTSGTSFFASRLHKPMIFGCGLDLGDRSSPTRSSRVLGRVSYKAIERLNLHILRM